MSSVEIIKEYNLNTPTWEEAIANVNLSIQNKEEIKIKNPGFYVVHGAQRIPSVQKVLDDLKLTFAHLYMNVITSTGTFGNHKDTMNVWYWQCRGTTKWIINEKDEYIMEAGDLLHIPKGNYHNIIPLTPRVGVSMSNK
tara:strand:- start:224 stop:640 length:417 start_codon:yes stop_codon:yes gene_type:complete